MKNFTLVLMGILLFVTADLSAATYYVKTNGDDTNNGSSWSAAFKTLQKALTTSVSGDEIWVAAGTYYPTSDHGLGLGDRGKHFRMKNGVKIYGGFPADITRKYLEKL